MMIYFGAQLINLSTPVASLGRQKSVGGRPAEHSLSSSPATTQSSVEGKRDTMSKHSEAMEFRAWCESECVRLVRAKRIDKQSRSEAEMLLIENLGSFDPDHEFRGNLEGAFISDRGLMSCCAFIKQSLVSDGCLAFGVMEICKCLLRSEGLGIIRS
ncbi:hypothetical protein NC652_033975 [Populus alba x Populus x berolinensis]|uniref:Uncharacterized protein n=1 Tax=Populus alba x Populus x berolinensis TaxID=444605 RepID=A0AAD6PZL6_9ROSI|nr:hypothetical protein NC652_033975 [Populus alba x Populus x berolinensis]KAJ6973674.1 hypothetical protein NC653_033880 [Populus alba x Populus x berolinensis]